MARHQFDMDTYTKLIKSIIAIIERNINNFNSKVPLRAHGILMHGPVVKIVEVKYINNGVRSVSLEAKVYPDGGLNLMKSQDQIQFIECVQKLFIEYDILYSNI